MNMNFEERICRLCLQTNHNRDSDRIESGVMRMIDMLLLKLNLELSCEPVICNECVINLDKFCNFKSTCIENGQPFIKSEENVPLSSGDIDSNRNKNVEITNMPICQFCMGKAQIGCCTYLCDMKNIFIADMIQKHIPELNLNILQGVPVCETCLETLQSFSSFIMNCLDVEGKIEQYISRTDGVLGHIKLFDVQQFTVQLAIKHESNDSDTNVFEVGHCGNGTEIKSENFSEVDILLNLNGNEMEIKSEENDCESEREHEAYSKQGFSEIKAYQSQLHPFVMNQSNSPKQRILNPQCHLETNTSFETKTEYSLDHQNTLTQPDNPQDHMCDEYSYKTKCKVSLSSHMLIHRNPADIKMYPCEFCEFVAKRESNLKRHLLTHINLLEVLVVRCQECPFGKRYKSCLKRHVLTHHDLSEVTLYTCESCPFKTKFKYDLKKHMAKHIGKSFKCPFEDKRKPHNLPHIPAGADGTCDTCSYKSKLKANLRRHMATHSDQIV